MSPEEIEALRPALTPIGADALIDTALDALRQKEEARARANILSGMWEHAEQECEKLSALYLELKERHDRLLESLEPGTSNKEK